MRKVFFFLVCVFGAYGKGWCQSEKAMLKQIAALQVYIADAEHGYKIAEDGLHTIGDIKNGEFNLHSAFFSSLKTVSPPVKKMAEVSEIIALQAAIVRRFSQSLKGYQQSGQFSADGLKYISNVSLAVTSAGLKDLSDLSAILTDDQLEMDDGTRIKRIKVIDGHMGRLWSFTNQFMGQADVLALQQTRGRLNVLTEEQLYGIK